jgi:hypothetical protein
MDLLCVVCQQRKQKSPADFELTCSCDAGHGVCRSCYATHGPGPGAPYAEIQKYGWKAFGGLDCAPLARCRFDTGERFCSVESLRALGFAVIASIENEHEALRQGDIVRRARYEARSRLSRRLVFVFLFLCLFSLFYFAFLK